MGVFPLLGCYAAVIGSYRRFGKPYVSYLQWSDFKKNFYGLCDF
jgi:hypothetical protein